MCLKKKFLNCLILQYLIYLKQNSDLVKHNISLSHCHWLKKKQGINIALLCSGLVCVLHSFQWDEKFNHEVTNRGSSLWSISNSASPGGDELDSFLLL